MAGTKKTNSDVLSIDDLLLKILLHVPAKPLTRLKLVSKRWESLITAHHASFLQKQGPIGLICPDQKIPLFEFIPLSSRRIESPFSVIRLPGGIPGCPYRIRQSCNGLLLISNTCGSLFYYRGIWSPLIVSCWVYNPTTKRNAQIHIPRNIIQGLNLAFDPAKSPGYKLVCVRSTRDDSDDVQIKIYSSQSRAWKLSGEPFSSTANFDNGVYWNGSVQWVDSFGKQILRFKVDEEELVKVPLPPAMRGVIAYFGESGDYLHVVEARGGERATRSFHVHEMNKGCEQWFVKYRVDLTSAGGDICRVFSLVRGVVDEGSFLFFEDAGKFIGYNLDRNTFQQILGIEDVEDIQSPTFQHIQSLAHV